MIPTVLVPCTSSAPMHGGEAQWMMLGAHIPGRWWPLYRSAELDALVEQALAANPDLDAAQTLMDGGQLEHKKGAAVAAYDQAAAHYRSAVLSAFPDVAIALRALEADADAPAATSGAEQAARQNLNLSQQQCALGAINYLTLPQALSGGWWNRADVDPGSPGRPSVFCLPPAQDVKSPQAGRWFRGRPRAAAMETRK